MGGAVSVGSPSLEGGGRGVGPSTQRTDRSAALAFLRGLRAGPVFLGWTERDHLLLWWRRLAGITRPWRGRAFGVRRLVRPGTEVLRRGSGRRSLGRVASRRDELGVLNGAQKDTAQAAARRWQRRFQALGALDADARLTVRT